MSGFFRPYEGHKPFVFVSYSHQNSDRVLQIISPLHNQMYRVWYDEGIPAGGDWSKNIAQHMRATAAVLFFISAPSLASVNCFNEITEAVKQHKPILCVRLDEAALPAEWVPLIGQAPTLTERNVSADSLTQAILEQGIISAAFLGDGMNDTAGGKVGIRFNGWILASIAGVLLLVATAAGTYGLANNWFDAYLPVSQTNVAALAATPAPTAVPTPAPTINLEGPWAGMLSKYAAFPDEQQERAVRAALGQPEGDVLMSDLLMITQLHFCGNMVLQSDAGIAFDRNGSCSVNSAPVIQGGITDLKLIADMPALERLSIVCQKIDSLSPLSSLTLLTELNAAGNPISDIGDLSGMASLVTLRLEHTQIRDFSGLNGLSQLKTVTASADMFPLKLDAATQKYDVVLVP